VLTSFSSSSRRLIDDDHFLRSAKGLNSSQSLFIAIEAAERALVPSGRTSIPLTTSLRPGESYETLLVFDLPNSAPSPRLYVGVHGIEAFLIGHEDSPLHKKIWFRI